MDKNLDLIISRSDGARRDLLALARLRVQPLEIFNCFDRIYMLRSGAIEVPAREVA